MNCLYESFTVFSFDEYKKFVEATSNQKRSNILLGIVSAILVIMGIVQKSPLLIVMAAVYPVLMRFSQKKALEKTYKRATAMHDARIDYRFYEDRFVKVFAENEEEYEYEKLYKITETETNFYLMISKTQGYVLVKDNMPEGLADFLKSLQK